MTSNRRERLSAAQEAEAERLDELMDSLPPEGITIRLPQGEALDRIGACAVCMTDIGDGAYAKVFQRFEEPLKANEALAAAGIPPIEGINVTVHIGCIDEATMEVREQRPAR